MSSMIRLIRFAHRPLPDKWATITRRIRQIVTLRTALRGAVVHARAAHIDFCSGLGDSAALLYALTRSMKPAICVEIGSARGKSACYIGMALKENGLGKLYAIDPHSPTHWNDPGSVDSFSIFCANIAALGLKEQVTIVRSTSEDASRSWHYPIDLLFVDGDHTYEGVKRDWELFSPHVRPFGFVVFHDTMWDFPPYCDYDYARAEMGVPRFVDELRRQGYPTLTIDKDFGLTLVQPIIGGQPLCQRSDLGALPAHNEHAA